MSGYFGALMRSSGMAIVARPRAIASVEPRVMEIDVERPAAMPAPSSPTVSPPHKAATLFPVPSSVPQPARQTLPAADEPRREGQSLSVAEPAPVRATTDKAGDAPSPRTPRRVDAPQRDLGQAVVRAAMKWVAADTPHAIPQIVTHTEPSSPIGGEENTGTITPAPALHEHRGEVETTRSNVTLERRPIRTREAGDPIDVHAVPKSSARPTPALPTAVLPSARDEVVEVSIGAIHVRVDAPQVQTVTRPAASPPAPARRATAESTARSALSRRALRRI
jgi:hypothetical protein